MLIPRVERENSQVTVREVDGNEAGMVYDVQLGVPLDLPRDTPKVHSNILLRCVVN